MTERQKRLIYRALRRQWLYCHERYHRPGIDEIQRGEYKKDLEDISKLFMRFRAKQELTK